MAMRQKSKSKEEWHETVLQSSKCKGSITQWREENELNAATYKYWVTQFNKEIKDKKALHNRNHAV